MRKLQLFSAVSGLAVAGTIAAFPTPQAAGEQAPENIIATGLLPSEFELADVEVELVPNITDQTDAGQLLPEFYVSDDHLTLGSDNRLTVSLSADEVPNAFRSSSGLVDVKIDASDGVVAWTTILTSQAVDVDGESQWVDPADLQQAVDSGKTSVRYVGRTAVVGDSKGLGPSIASLDAPSFTSPEDPDYSEDNPPTGDDTWGEGDDDRSGWNGGAVEPRVIPGCPDGGSGPHQTEYLSRKKAWSTIGTSYPVGNSTAFMKVTSGSSNGARYGGAVKYSAVSASVSGSSWAEGSWTKTWLEGGASRSYRKQVEYIRVKYYNYLSGPACDHVHWIADKETGGTAINKDGVTRPDWDDPNKCSRQSPGPFERDSAHGNNYEYGAAVKLKDVIGTDLGISRGYTSRQKITYQIRGTGHWLCGNDDYPSLSGKLMEWKQRPY